MNLTELIGRLLGLEKAVDLGRGEVSLSAPWAHDHPAWLVFACVGAAVLALLFYTRYQYARRAKTRMLLAVVRATLLGLLLLILAEPVLTIRSTSQLRPALWLVFDGTDSMGIADELPEADRAQLNQAVGMPEPSPGEVAAGVTDRPTRTDYLKAFVSKEDENLLEKLEENFRVRTFVFDRADGVRALDAPADKTGRIDPKKLAEQLTTEGKVTAVGEALNDLSRRHATSNLAGVVVFSDFNQNAGPAPVDAAKRLGVHVYTVGVGAVVQVNLAVDIQCPPMMKKDEQSHLLVTLRPESLAGRTVSVKISARQRGGTEEADRWKMIDQREVTLGESAQVIDLPHVPKEVGRFMFRVETVPFAEEVVVDDNHAECETQVHDNVMRLLFVDYEPTWEWRFVKEVFHRDKLVGEKGFRTFLRSADPKVREANELFVKTLSPPREEFFNHDVIILGDMPASALSPRFCDMTKEFVEKLGGGLVVVAGPRFGPGQLNLTSLGDLLPVKVSTELHTRDRQPFRLQRTPEAAGYDFMQMESSPAANDKAWNNLGLLPWYQPVERLQVMAEALAVHPTDKCVDGKTRQPIIAVRRYAASGGEVVYLGFNEMWRLRRSYGERYYREFWGTLIHRLATNHALGAQKRFNVRTDRQRYQPNDNVFVTVQAYDSGFKELTEDKINGGKLTAELITPPAAGSTQPATRQLTIAQRSPGVFETKIPVALPGEHRIRVFDPVKKENVEATFQVASVSVERQRAVRNVALAQAIAENTGGKSYDLTNASRLADEVRLVSKTETSIEVIPLWNTYLAFALVAMLMLGEWLGRKLVNLP